MKGEVQAVQAISMMCRDQWPQHRQCVSPELQNEKKILVCGEASRAAGAGSLRNVCREVNG